MRDDNLFLIKTSFFSNPIDKYFILCYTVKMIEVRFEKSNCHEKALDRALWQGKVLVPKNSFDSSRSWQTGEYPSCCRSNAESYPTSDFQIDGCVVT